MRINKVFVIFLAAVSITGLSGCKTTQEARHESFCENQKLLCLVAGGVIVGTIASLNSADSSNQSADGSVGPLHCHINCMPISDMRLKKNIHFIGTAENGLKFYSFRYFNSGKIFTGVMAQDLLDDKRYVNAVEKTVSGYYAVNYSKLGITPLEKDAMLAAGRAALKDAPKISGL